jgi:hypothetical protein
MSSFIRSMPSAGLIEMPPLSNVTHHHQPRRFGAAAGDAEQHPHAELLELLLVEDLERHARSGDDRLRSPRELARCERVSGFVGHVARKVAALGQQPAPSDSRGTLGRADNRPRRRLSWRNVARLVAPGVELRQRQAFCSGLARFHLIGAAPRTNDKRRAADTTLLQRQSRRRGDLPRDVAAEVRHTPGADKCNATYFPRRIRDGSDKQFVQPAR